jgi:tetratricopeptide (TPR) repeat protein
MRSRSALTLLAGVVAASLALGTLAAHADPPKAKEILRDPENRKGISPYMELIVKGQATLVARDIPGAIASFQEAVKLRPDEMLAFYRLGEAEQEAGNLDDADKTWEAALSKKCTQGCELSKGPNDLKGKVLFNIAFLRERQQKWAAAKDAWESYAAFLQGNPKVHGYPATAADRIKQIDRRVQLEVDYGKVKERIAQRIAQKEKEAAENAKKDKLNK